jgi:DNA-binding Lrp family transcriptional regulator
MSTAEAIPTEYTDPINSQILAVSEDKLSGFYRYPFQEIAERANLPESVVMERIRAMLEAGVIRRVRQTLLSTNLAEGALTAWKVPQEKLDETFEFMFRNDPFSGHVVVRSTDQDSAGSDYKLWTTLKVPPTTTLEEHGRRLLELTEAESFKLMPAKGIFALGVGHVRRKNLEPGDKSPEPAVMRKVGVVDLNDEQWHVLDFLKREFQPEEIQEDPWAPRAEAAGKAPEDFFRVAEELERKGVIGRFSTFLEHVKPDKSGKRLTRFNGLFHWAVPPGMEEAAGSEVGRHLCLTHCYWREGGPVFNNVNIMAVAHGMEKEKVLEHKAAIDAHLEACNIPVSYTNVFWGGRSEIKPSEIMPHAYKAWLGKWFS